MSVLPAIIFGSGMFYGYGTLINDPVPLSTVLPLMSSITVWNSINIQNVLRQNPKFMFISPLYPISFTAATLGTVGVFELGNLFIKMAKPLIKNVN